MKYIYLAIFIVFTTIHLYGSYIKNNSLRNSTKSVILLAILGFYLCCIDGMDKIGWLVSLAIIFSWLGDVLLIPHGVKWFTIGGIMFWISHGFFIASYNQYIDFYNIPLWLLIPICLICGLVVTYLFSKLKKHLPKPLFYPMYFYLLTNGAMNCFAWFRLISEGFNLATLTTAIGALGFFISDCTLFFVRFNKECKIKSHFLVMLTYSIGEFLIILGLVL